MGLSGRILDPESEMEARSGLDLRFGQVNGTVPASQPTMAETKIIPVWRLRLPTRVHQRQPGGSTWNLCHWDRNGNFFWTTT